MRKQIILPEYVAEFMDQSRKNGFEIYLVGGAVRDLLLSGKGPRDNNWDFATNARPEQIVKIYKDAKYNNKFGTVIIPVSTAEDQQILFEITPYRKETKYEDFRHPSHIEWASNLKQDLMRRDFTINAMATDGKKIIDITEGQKDLKKKIIRTVGKPEIRFHEDALRMLRAIRLACQLGFLIEDKTREGIKQNASLIQQISWERIRDELLKILASDHPSEGILFMRNTDLLQYILPELDRCFAIPQKSPKRHHVYDVGTHSVQALKHCPSKDPITRFAALIHDIGKVQTYAKDEDTGLITFFNHQVVSAAQAEKIAERLRLSRQQKKKLVNLVEHHMFTVSEHQSDKAIRRFIRNVGKENLEDILALRTGDRIGSGATPTSWRTEEFKKRLKDVQKVPFSIKDLKINGLDVMKTLNIKPGPKVGQVLQEIFELVDEGKLKNVRKTLLEKIASYKSLKKD